MKARSLLFLMMLVGVSCVSYNLPKSWARPIPRVNSGVADPTIFVTDQVEGSLVVITCEYWKTYEIAGVYSIEEQGGIWRIVTRDGKETKLVKNNVIGYEVRK